MKRRNAMVVALGLVVASVASGAEPPPEGERAAAPATDADVLRGPSIIKHEERPERSIVERDFQGRVKKLEENPALVALGQLTLTEEEKKKVEKALGDRAAALDVIVRDNLKLIVELAQAKQSGDYEGGNRLQAEVLKKAEPFLKRGPLINEVRSALPEGKFAELKGMVDEYNRSAAGDKMSDPMSGPKQENKFGAMLAQGFEGFAAEAKASFQRITGGEKDFENLIKMLVLTPEQESKVRQLAGDLFQKTYGKPTKAQQIGLFLNIYKELDAAQRHRLAEYIGEENRVKRGTGK